MHKMIIVEATGGYLAVCTCGWKAKRAVSPVSEACVEYSKHKNAHELQHGDYLGPDRQNRTVLMRTAEEFVEATKDAK